MQQILLDLCERLNEAHSTDPSRELRIGITYLLRSILHNMPLVAAKPGDMEPEQASQPSGEHDRDCPPGTIDG